MALKLLVQRLQHALHRALSAVRVTQPVAIQLLHQTRQLSSRRPRIASADPSPHRMPDQQVGRKRVSTEMHPMPLGQDHDPARHPDWAIRTSRSTPRFPWKTSTSGSRSVGGLGLWVEVIGWVEVIAAAHGAGSGCGRGWPGGREGKRS
jgi:hypothetical protein